MTTLKAPRKTGHWLRNDVPHSGWRCEGIRDERGICAMCEVTKIAYSHIMVHEKLPGVEPICGCVCAAYMTGNAKQERLRELLYKWQLAVRENKPAIEKLRRKGWHGSHYTSGAHEWGLCRKGEYVSFFTVRVQDRDGWRYSIWRPRHQWDKTKHIHSEPFASDIEAALAGIARAELLRADPQWMEADRVAEAAHIEARRKESQERELRNAIRWMNETGNADLAAALEQGSITATEAYLEQNRRARDEQRSREIERQTSGEHR